MSVLDVALAISNGLGLAAFFWAMWQREKALSAIKDENAKSKELQDTIAGAQDDTKRLRQVVDTAKQALIDADRNTRALIDAAHAAGVDLSAVSFDQLRATAGRPVRAGGDAVPEPIPADVSAGRASKPVP